MARSFQQTGVIQRACLIAVPVLLLIYDFWSFPVTFSVRGLNQGVSVSSLVANRLLLLGTYNTHKIYVSLDSINRQDFIDYIKGSPSAIVISYFVEPESSESELYKGILARALEAKLDSVSSEAGRAYQDQLNRLSGRAQGDVVALDLRMSQQAYHKLPIDSVYVVIANTVGQSNREVLAKAIPRVIEQADQRNVANLIFPCIGYNWENKNSPIFDEFFVPLFDALSKEGAPRAIYVPLFSGWPTFTLEGAVKSLNHCWEKTVTSSVHGAILQLYRGDYRWTLLFLSVCLLVSSFYAPLTFKNFLIICVSFIAVATGAVKTLDFVTQGHGVLFCEVAKIATLGFLAAGFPFLINWNPKNVFSKEDDRHA